jgi:hypothetical protein
MTFVAEQHCDRLADLSKDEIDKFLEFLRWTRAKTDLRDTQHEYFTSDEIEFEANIRLIENKNILGRFDTRQSRKNVVQITDIESYITLIEEREKNKNTATETGQFPSPKNVMKIIDIVNRHLIYMYRHGGLIGRYRPPKPPYTLETTVLLIDALRLIEETGLYSSHIERRLQLGWKFLLDNGVSMRPTAVEAGDLADTLELQGGWWLNNVE